MPTTSIGSLSQSRPRTSPQRLRQLQTDGLAGQVTNMAIDYLSQLFAAGPNAIGSLMAGRAETGEGDPEVVSASVARLSEDLCGRWGAD